MKLKLFASMLISVVLVCLFAFSASAAVEEIGTADELAALMADNTKWAGSYKLTADIDLTGKTQSPIGTSAVPFTGTFDGDGHEITNLSLTGYTTTDVALFGRINGGATIKNLTVSGTVSTSNSRSGGLVGQVTGSATVSNCTADIDVTAAGGGAGGIVGTFAITNTGDALVVENCVNKGDVTGKQYNAGIVGFATGSKTGISLTVTGCKNYGDISTTTGNVCAGIFGYANYVATSGTNVFAFADCANYGNIDCGGATGYVGGIVGAIGAGKNNAYATNATIENCYNEGVITGVNYVGGIAGLLRPLKSGGYTLTDLMTADAAGLPVIGAYGTGTKTFTVTRGYTVNGTAVVGAVSGNTTNAVDCYTSASSDIELVTLVNTSKWVMGEENPELKTFHVHNLTAKYIVNGTGHSTSCYCEEPETIGAIEAHNMSGGICTVCGAADCPHTNTTVVVTMPATCQETGFSNTVCDDCDSIVSENDIVAIDLNNHAILPVVFEHDKTNNHILYKTQCCDTVIYTDETVGQDIYVSESGVDVTANNAFTGDLGLSESTAFADLELAIEYAAIVSTIKGSATIHILDKGTISSASYVTPSYTGMLTITGGEMVFTSAATRFIQSGDVTIENTKITNAAGLVWPARGHKIVMGTGITHGSDKDIYLLGGWQGSVNGKGGEINGDVTVRSGEWYVVAAGNRQGSLTHYGNSTMTIGTANDTDTLTIEQLAPFHINGGDLSADSSTTVIVDGKVNVTSKLYAGIHTTSSAVGVDYTYTVNFVLKNGADITSNNALTNQAPQSTIIWNVYADQRSEAAIADAERIVKTDNITVNQYTYVDYCTDVLDGHYGDGDNCTECGANLKCTHEGTKTTWETVTEATCSTKGLEKEICECLNETGKTRETELDPNNHIEEQEYVWSKNAETNAYEILCSGCGVAIHTQTETPVVYIGDGGDDSADGLSAANKVATLYEAVSRLANVDNGTVMFNGVYTVSANIILPAWSGELLFTADPTTHDSYGAAKSGIVIGKHGVTLSLGGDSKFDGLLLKGTSSTVCRIIISANWNDIEMGYIRSQAYAKIYLVAGVYYPTADDIDPKTSSVIVDGPAMSTNAGDYLYERIYLGSIYLADGITVSNKNVTAILRDGFINTKDTTRDQELTVGTLYTMSTTGIDSYMHSTTDNCTTTVYANDNTGIIYVRTGDKNVNHSDCSGKIDNVIFYFNDNSNVVDGSESGTFYVRNAVNVSVYVSDMDEEQAWEGEGVRTTAFAHSIVLYKNGAFANESASATFTYGTHSFVTAITDPVKNNGNYELTRYVNDECEGNWDEGVVTEEPTISSDGVMTYTCKACGRTKTAAIPFLCEVHQYVAMADGSYICQRGCSDVSTPDAPVVVGINPATVINGTVTVTVFVDANTPIVANRFKVNAPEGFELIAAESLLGEVGADVSGFTLTGQEALTLPYEAVLLNMTARESSFDSAVLKLTFKVADSVESGAVITVESLETYDEYAEDVVTASVSAEITVANVLEETYKYGISATLANELLLEYLIRFDAGVAYDECYLVVEHYANGSLVPEIKMVEAHAVNSDETQNVYRFYAPGVAAKEMNDRIVVTFYAVVDGELYAAETFEKNIVDYYNSAYKAYGEITEGQAPALMNVLNALLNYGAEAQRYFGYNVENLVNAVLPAEKQVTTFEAEASGSLIKEDDCASDMYSPIGLAPLLEERVEMRLSFVGSGEVATDVKFVGSYTDINGNPQEFEVAAEVTGEDGEYSVTVYVDVVSAKDLRQIITGALYSGETRVSDSVSFSFECYANLAEEAEKNICNAILNYCDAAKALFYKEPAAQ